MQEEGRENTISTKALPKKDILYVPKGAITNRSPFPHFTCQTSFSIPSAPSFWLRNLPSSYPSNLTDSHPFNSAKQKICTLPIVFADDSSPTALFADSRVRKFVFYRNPSTNWLCT